MSRAPTEAPPVTAAARTVHGFGGGPGAGVVLVRPADPDEAQAAVAWCCAPERRGAIARGLGRSYGDAAQLDGGHVLDMTGLDGFEVDAAAGTVTAFAGATLGALLADLVPAGWILPVLPGTQHVTVGGAIASDVHGKNHPAAGSFGAHVEAVGLLTAAGELLELSPGGELFEATVGGMGLTGVILWARIALEPVPGDLVGVDTDRAASLEDALALLAAPGPAGHRIAWLDLLGPSPGRGIVTRSQSIAGHAREPGRRATRRASLTVPEGWPGGVLRAASVRAFNELRYRRAPRAERGRPQPLGAHMFPLDALEAWPRLYGAEGLLQYQFAVPRGGEAALRAAIAGLGAARVPCFLATLKALGPASAAPLSFPLAGWTLALDIPRAAAGVAGLLDRLDEVVAEAGGRVYLTKDARMGPAALAAMYPRLADWQAARDAADPGGAWRSDLALRVGLIPGGDG
jgi:decaprenylphospho-beta-D-ribofuranose 2-oxidase